MQHLSSLLSSDTVTLHLQTRQERRECGKHKSADKDESNTGYAIPEPGCLGLIDGTRGAIVDERREFREYHADVVFKMTPLEASNPIYKCINGTTMKSLFITFLVLFGFRLLVSLASQYVISPLILKLNILKEDSRLRNTIKDKAMARLAHAKVRVRSFFCTCMRASATGEKNQ